jgi:hypothetical protein
MNDGLTKQDFSLMEGTSFRSQGRNDKFLAFSYDLSPATCDLVPATCNLFASWRGATGLSAPSPRTARILPFAVGFPLLSLAGVRQFIDVLLNGSKSGVNISSC